METDQNQNKDVHIGALVPYTVYPAKMGGQKGIALFYSHLCEKLKVTVMSTCNNEFPTGSRARFMKVLSNKKSRYANPLLFFRMRSLIRSEGFTHLILEHPYYGWLGLLLSWFSKVSIVIHSHNIEGLRFKSTGKWWWGILWHYEKWTHRMADINFFVTEEDRQYAIRHFRLAPGKCHSITYGIDIPGIPTAEDRTMARQWLQKNYGIGPDEQILLFNGTLDYKPNTDAVEAIIRHINPLLQRQRGFHYRIMICGKNLPASFPQSDKGMLAEHVQYAGFVDDIRTFFLGSDIFLNPVTDGGGIKTKLVEAIGFNLSAVSTQNGAIGVNPALAPGKLMLIGNNDWEAFANAIISMDLSENTSQSFFNHFYWANIADKAAYILKN